MSEERICVPNSYYVCAPDLYTNFNVKKNLDGPIKDWDWKKYKQTFAQMLRYLFYLVVLDIIEDNVTFKFPDQTYLEMVPYTGDEFIKMRQLGAFQDVDFLVSNFTGYKLRLTYKTRYGKWRKCIAVSDYLRDRITEYTNKGKRYG